jgi:hypothetical protein
MKLKKMNWNAVLLRSVRLVAASLVATASATAQVDYRNLDDDRPTLTEDAYPIERYAWEVMLPYHFEREAGSSRHVLLAELTHAPARNLHLGIKVPIAVADPQDGPASGVELSGFKLYGLYNFNTEGAWLPALALRTDLTLPWGGLGGDATRVTLKAIATRTWGLTRLHVNAARSFGDEGQLLAAAEPASRWWVSAAVDRTLFRQSTLLLAEVYARRDMENDPVEWVATVGTRYQWRPTLVLDLGLSRRLRDGVGPDIGVNVGLTYAFAIRGLMPRGPR